MKAKDLTWHTASERSEGSCLWILTHEVPKARPFAKTAQGDKERCRPERPYFVILSAVKDLACHPERSEGLSSSAAKESCLELATSFISSS